MTQNQQIRLGQLVHCKPADFSSLGLLPLLRCPEGLTLPSHKETIHTDLGSDPWEQMYLVLSLSKTYLVRLGGDPITTDRQF